MKKFISGLIVGIMAVLIINVLLNKDDVNVSDDKRERSDRIVSVLDNVWDEFGLFSYNVGDTDPTIWIVMDETKSDVQLQKYLEKNIKKSDLNHYNLDIQKRSVQEVETEYFMIKVSHIVGDHIKEKEYQNVDIQSPSIAPEPLITLTISENSELSSEDLQKEIEDLLDSKNSELPKGDIPYKIKVIEG